MCADKKVQIWGGIEATINRVNNEYYDQCEYSGHYDRDGDVDLIASLGVKMLRYPVLWEKHQPLRDSIIDWTFVDKNLHRLKKLRVEPIAGLVHHGSGPAFVNFFDGSFEEGVANYARLVAEKFPWLEYYTPINEPLTTARFCGLYGHWYPHKKDDYSFYKILLSECRATVMAMKEIRKVNPDAKLIQTEDLGKVYSTPALSYQADFENQRRWLSYDLICGRVNRQHPLWDYLTKCIGLAEDELDYFRDNHCIPHICGFNYYLTSERFLDEDLSKYPTWTHGTNGRHEYADIEAVRVSRDENTGPYIVLKEAFNHLQLPIAVTECHLHCTREEQMRWFNEMWKTVNKLKADGVDIRALTAWAIFGLRGWNNLVREPWGKYEPGVFNLSSGCPRPTALARLIQVFTEHKVYYHPVLETEGWWKRETRILYPSPGVISMKGRKQVPDCRPVVIIERPGGLGLSFSRIFAGRNIHDILLSLDDIDISDQEAVEQIIRELNPWAIINAAGYTDIDAEEQHAGKRLKTSSTEAVTTLASACEKHSVKLLSFSSDLVFDGLKGSPYIESDQVNPLNAYGRSSVVAEERILGTNPDALIIRTSNFFGPWDKMNFVFETLSNLKQGRTVTVASDVHISPTYIPDLVNESIDLLLDNERGIFHVTSHGQTTWAAFAGKIAELAGCDTSLINAVPLSQISSRAKRPLNSVLISEKGIKLPNLDDALLHYFETVANVYQSSAIAV